MRTNTLCIGLLVAVTGCSGRGGDAIGTTSSALTLSCGEVESSSVSRVTAAPCGATSADPAVQEARAALIGELAAEVDCPGTEVLIDVVSEATSCAGESLRLDLVLAARCVCEACADGEDNDGDGLVDCGDADDCRCFAGECGDELVCTEACWNGLDDDGDGESDCSDLDCPTADPCTPEVCDDGLDQDLDGLVDCSDPDCADDRPCVMRCPADACSAESEDNPVGACGSCSIVCSLDPSCCLASWDWFCVDLATTYCSCAGPESRTETCGNDEDDDGNGLADCHDPQCWAESACQKCPADPCTEDSTATIDCAEADADLTALCDANPGCCVDRYDGDWHWPGSCVVKATQAGLCAATACGDENCDGFDDCTGVSSGCAPPADCGDEDCNGFDDCSGAPGDCDVAPCGDGDCNLYDDCSGDRVHDAACGCGSDTDCDFFDDCAGWETTVCEPSYSTACGDTNADGWDDCTHALI